MENSNLMVDYQPGLFKCVSIFDPTIDHKNSKVSEYSRTRKLELLKFNGDPTYFYLRTLSPLQVGVINLKTGDYLNDFTRITYFQYSIHHIENIKLSNGKDIPSWEPCEQLFEVGGTAINVISNKELTTHLFKPAVVIEIGNVAHSLSFLVPGTELSLIVLPSYQVFMDQKKNQ